MAREDKIFALLERHKHHLALVLILAIIGVTFWVAIRENPQPPKAANLEQQDHTETEYQKYPCSELPKLARALPHGARVQVAFPLALVPTSDPLTWEYHPGTPPAVAPLTYRVVFLEAPIMPARPPAIVRGEATFQPDAVRRVSGVPGFVLLRRASLQSQP